MINSVMAGITKTKLYDKTANYYDWKEVYPQLKLLKDNIQDLKNDAKLIETVRTYVWMSRMLCILLLLFQFFEAIFFNTNYVEFFVFFYYFFCSFLNNILPQIVHQFLLISMIYNKCFCMEKSYMCQSYWSDLKYNISFLDWLILIVSSPWFLKLSISFNWKQFILYSGYRGRKIIIQNRMVEKRIGRYFRFYIPFLPQTRKIAHGSDQLMSYVARLPPY